HAPGAAKHGVEVLVIAREMQNGATDHHVGERIRKRHCLDRFDAEVLRGTGCREAPHGRYRLRLRIRREDLVSFPEKVHEIAPEPAPRFEHAAPGGNAATQQLIEKVDIDLAELVLKGGHPKPVRLYR